MTRLGDDVPLITADNVGLFTKHLRIRSGDLPYPLWAVFDRAQFDASPHSRLVPVSALVSTKDHSKEDAFRAGLKADSRETAFRRMIEAALGRVAARAPLSVRQDGEATYFVVDGNATAQVLMLVGWPLAPVMLTAPGRLPEQPSPSD